MEEEYKWNVVDNDLRLNLTKNGKMTAQYKGMHGNVLCELNMFDHYNEERIARVIVYKEIPELAEFSSGRVHIQRSLRKLKSASIPEHRHAEGLRKLIKMIEEELPPMPCSEPTKAN